MYTPGIWHLEDFKMTVCQSDGETNPFQCVAERPEGQLLLKVAENLS